MNNTISQLVEQQFGYNEFNQPNKLTGLQALAKIFLNLLTMEPKTIPSSPEMGVGIALYRMEFNNQDTYADIRNTFKSQINRFYPQYSKYVRDIIIEKIPENQLNSGGNGIYIAVALSESDEIDKDQIIVYSNINNPNNGKTITTFTII